MKQEKSIIPVVSRFAIYNGIFLVLNREYLVRIYVTDMIIEKSNH